MLKLTKILILVFIFPMLLSAQMADIKNFTLFLPCFETQKLVPERHRIAYTANDDYANVIFCALKSKTKEHQYINIFPENSYAVLDGDNATVDISKIHIPKNLENLKAEYLTIYSIVNSLTSTGHIITVRFTQNGKDGKDFYGFTDMRETFIPDYDICS